MQIKIKKEKDPEKKKKKRKKLEDGTEVVKPKKVKQPGEDGMKKPKKLKIKIKKEVDPLKKEKEEHKDDIKEFLGKIYKQTLKSP